MIWRDKFHESRSVLTLEFPSAMKRRRVLKEIPAHVTVLSMKLLPIDEAQAHLDTACQAALSGEVIRVQLANGAQIELKPVPISLLAPELSQPALAACYDDAEWAAFENRCGRSSD